MYLIVLKKNLSKILFILLRS